MTTVQEKQLALLEETIAFFNLNNRSASPLGGCFYFREGKDGCAIGRKIADKDLCRKMDDIGELTKVFHLLPADLQELGVTFLNDLQKLHDNEDYWTELGLSQEGFSIVEMIKRNHINT